MKTNQQLKNAALDRLRGNWAPGVLATLIYCIITVVFVGTVYVPMYFPMSYSSRLGLTGCFYLASFFLVNPLSVGIMNAFRLLFERRDDRVAGNMFYLAFSKYWHKVGGMFLMGLKVFLWTLLFIIPGIIMAFAYAMTPFILDEHPEIGVWEASTRSREMMRGHKFDYFWLMLSFIGWYILCILTLGIGFLWLTPYMQTTAAAFYNELKAEQGEDAVTE